MPGILVPLDFLVLISSEMQTIRPANNFIYPVIQSLINTSVELEWERFTTQKAPTMIFRTLRNKWLKLQILANTHLRLTTMLKSIPLVSNGLFSTVLMSSPMKYAAAPIPLLPWLPQGQTSGHRLFEKRGSPTSPRRRGPRGPTPPPSWVRKRPRSSSQWRSPSSRPSWLFSLGFLSGADKCLL